MILHTYFRSSASYRVRIALAIKGLGYEPRFVNLTRAGGEQYTPNYQSLNPQARVPVLEIDGQVLTQSLAIIEYLDERFAPIPLLPADAWGRARVRSLAQLIACDTQPLQNTSTTRYLKSRLGCTETQIAIWLRDWISRGLDAMEMQVARDPMTGHFIHGQAPSLADCCLVPQLYAARRFGVDIAAYPTLLRIELACLERADFQLAAPDRQQDAE